MWYKLKRILIYPDGVTEKQVYPAWWKPWANTIAYYPLNWDANDYSWNSRNLTATDITYNTLSSWLKVAYLNWSSSYAIINNQSISMSECTLNIWIKRWQISNSETWWSIWYWGDAAYRISPNSSTEWNLWHLLYANWWVFQWTNNTWIRNWEWANYVSVTTSSGNKFYVNGQEVALSYSRWNSSIGFGTRNFNNIVIWKHPTISADRTKWEASNWIIEDKARTAEEVAKYYNLTKAKYWL